MPPSPGRRHLTPRLTPPRIRILPPKKTRRKLFRSKWPEWESNPHTPYGIQDFKSCASANFAIRPERVQKVSRPPGVSSTRKAKSRVFVYRLQAVEGRCRLKAVLRTDSGKPKRVRGIVLGTCHTAPAGFVYSLGQGQIGPDFKEKRTCPQQIKALTLRWWGVGWRG